MPSSLNNIYPRIKCQPLWIIQCIYPRVNANLFEKYISYQFAIFRRAINRIDLNKQYHLLKSLVHICQQERTKHFRYTKQINTQHLRSSLEGNPSWKTNKVQHCQMFLIQEKVNKQSMNQYLLIITSCLVI